MDEFRLDVVTETDPDTALAVSYFEADDGDAACEQAGKLLAAHDGPADRYGDLYLHNGFGTANYYDTIHLPE